MSNEKIIQYLVLGWCGIFVVALLFKIKLILTLFAPIMIVFAIIQTVITIKFYNNNYKQPKKRKLKNEKK